MKCPECGFEEKTDWSNTVILVCWTVFFGDVFLMLFHPWNGLFREYLWAMPMLNIAGIGSGVIIIFYMICSLWDKSKEQEIRR